MKRSLAMMCFLVIMISSISLINCVAIPANSDPLPFSLYKEVYCTGFGQQPGNGYIFDLTNGSNVKENWFIIYYASKKLKEMDIRVFEIDSVNKKLIELTDKIELLEIRENGDVYNPGIPGMKYGIVWRLNRDGADCWGVGKSFVIMGTVTAMDGTRAEVNVVQINIIPQT